MGIRQTLNRLRPEEGDSAPLRLTPAAVQAVRDRLAETGEAAEFFVGTHPSRLGFNVAVGFEHPEEDSERRSRPGMGVPVRVSDPDWERLRGYTVDHREGRFLTFTDVAVQVAETPNPESRKFMLNRSLLPEGGATFHRPPGTEDPILVQYLFDVSGVRSLFFIGNFCTVTREPGADWSALESEVGKRLQAYVAHGGAAITAPPRDQARLSEVERRIVDVLDDVVRPAVQRDGGDILFAGFDEGRVQLYMQGSCVGCPSSLATLKMGVENLLRDAVPEVREVVAIQ